tara:strand:+ start:24582 stop:25544 length:963 start_codon:yes stop_codon:yes gene_type:complete
MRVFLKNFGLFALSLIAISYVFVWIFEIPKREAIQNGTHDTAQKWEDIRNPNNNFDLIILGSSRGDSAYNPAIIDSVANTHSYNLCSGSQNLIESYYILKEVLKYQQPDFIVFDSYLPSFSEDPDYFHVLNNGEFMSRSGRWDMIINGFGIQGVAYYALPILKYRTYIQKDFKQLFGNKKVVIKKAKRIEGFYYGEEIVDATTVRSFGPLESLEETTIANDQVQKYLGLIKELCKSYNVEILPVRAPYPPSRQANFPDPAHVYFKNVLSEQELSLHDFNYIQLAGLKDEDFSDDRHLNFRGANKVSKALGGLILQSKTRQ